MKMKQNYVNAGLVMSSLLRSAKSKFPLLLAVTAMVITATSLRADSGGNQSEHNQLPGTWMSAPQPGNQSALASFISDGRVIFSRTITILPPSGFELVGTGHGEWIRTGNHEFAFTMFLLRSSPSAEFTGFVKVTATLKLNRASDQFTLNSTTYIFGSDGNLLFSFPDDPAVFKRVVAGQ